MIRSFNIEPRTSSFNSSQAILISVQTSKQNFNDKKAVIDTVEERLTSAGVPHYIFGEAILRRIDM